MKTDNKNKEATLIKWTKPQVAIKTYGNFNQILTDCLNQVIFDFNQLSQTTKFILNKNKGDIDFYLIPKEKFLEIEPNYIPDNDGYFWMKWDENNTITWTRILINSNDPSKDKERCHLIREELTQSMGLAQDSYKYEDSIFYAPWTTITNYSEVDKEIIKMLYNSGLRPKMTSQEIRNYFIVKE